MYNKFKRNNQEETMKKNLSTFSYNSHSTCTITPGSRIGLLLSLLITFGFSSKATEEYNLEKAIRYSKYKYEKDKDAYETYLRLYYFRLANGTSQNTATDLYKIINSCISGKYESKDITYLCSSLAIDARAKKLDLKEVQKKKN